MVGPSALSKATKHAIKERLMALVQGTARPIEEGDTFTSNKEDEGAARPIKEEDGFVLSAPPASLKTLALASARPLNLDQRTPLSSLKPRTLHLEAEAEERRRAEAARLL